MLLLYIFFGVIALFVLGLLISAFTPGEPFRKPGRRYPNRHMEDTWHGHSKNQGQDLLQASHKRFMDANHKGLLDSAALSKKTTQRSIDQSDKTGRERAKNFGKK
jgi:hypothetical protein